jgi:hypothetical protein
LYAVFVTSSTIFKSISVTSAILSKIEFSYKYPFGGIYEYFS